MQIKTNYENTKFFRKAAKHDARCARTHIFYYTRSSLQKSSRVKVEYELCNNVIKTEKNTFHLFDGMLNLNNVEIKTKTNANNELTKKQQCKQTLNQKM